MTIFTLHPEGQDSIAFEPLDVNQATDGYYAPFSDYRFNEATRIDIIYSDTAFGGRAISEKQNLVPVNFSVFVVGSTRNQMLERTQVLNRALMNKKGGRLEYRPDGATISTYYRYEKSKPATVQELKTNLWDSHTAEGQRYVMAFSVELMTHPVATSGDPVSITPSRNTLYTTTYIVSPSNLSYNYFELYNIKGDLPAIVNMRLAPNNSGTYNRVYLWSRSSVESVLEELVCSYESTSASNSGNWTLIGSEVSTTGSSYMRCAPSDYTTWHKLKFTINNEKEHRGFASIFISMHKNTNLPHFRVRLGYEVNDNRIWTSNTSYTTSTFIENTWHWEYVGDIQMPPMSLENEEEVNAQLVVEIQQVSGDFDKTFSIDNIQIMFTDLSALQINVGEAAAQTGGFTLVERLHLVSDAELKRVAEVRNSSNVYRRPAVSTFGSPLGLLAEADTRVFMLFEMAATETPRMYNIGNNISITTSIIYRTIFPFGD